MDHKTRPWVGITLLAVLLFNYTMIGAPLYRRIHSLENRIKTMMIKQVRSGDMLKNTEDTYIIDVLKRETISLDRKIVILNCVSASVAIIIVSWLIFAVAVRRQDRRRS